eukprot:TRINITY_DN496_c0_g3_i3.p1 TRINITY_DN496_c0_g3~~TRINITY_DN496_c0_g3_i3.p1  ORF type:complete len:337 (+),score=127.50 TRINITY_DN496_c0_g3_i3:44-1054(+)
MKAFSLLALPCVAFAMGSSGDAARAEFDTFKQVYGKVYRSAAEEERRFGVFKQSLARVAGSGNPAHGVTKFSDLTPEEFKQLYLGRAQQKAEEDAPRWNGECTACKRFPHHKNIGDNSTDFDWVPLGAVTKVKNQGQCGSCWTFGTTGDIEGTWFLGGNKLVSLSEQELVACDKEGGNAGCDGGLQERAFPWIIKKKGIASEEQYPYTSEFGIGGVCHTDRMYPTAANISSWFQVSKKASEEGDIKTQLPKVGPITIGINAGPMQDYTKGIDNPRLCNPESLDHAVLIVGYGEENGVNYWKIKNSWGPSWGESGYYRIVMGENKCGLANDAVHSVH